MKSKQMMIAALAAGLALTGGVAALTDRWWLAALSVIGLTFGVAIVAADVHRKVGRAIAEVRAGQASQASAFGKLESNVGVRFNAVEQSRQATLSELSALRTQLLARFDVLAKDLRQDAAKLARSAAAVEIQTGEMLESAPKIRDLVEEGTTRLRRLLDSARDRLDTASAEIDQTVLSAMSRAQTEERAATERLLQNLVTEMDAMLQVHERLNIDGPTPLMGGWAMSPTGMKAMIDLATRPGVTSIVECGSGTSTVLLALALQRIGVSDVRVVSLEHLPEYAELTRSRLQLLGMDGVVDVRHAPLEATTIDGVEYQWYAKSGYADVKSIDLLVVDGPPKSTGEHARYPAFPLLKHVLSRGASILLDDAPRAEEKAIAARWLEDELLVTVPGQDPGQLVMRYGDG